MDYLSLILMALFAMVCGSFAYTWKTTSRIWEYLTNHLTEKIRQVAREEIISLKQPPAD